MNCLICAKIQRIRRNIEEGGEQAEERVKNSMLYWIAFFWLVVIPLLLVLCLLVIRPEGLRGAMAVLFGGIGWAAGHYLSIELIPFFLKIFLKLTKLKKED